MFEHDKKTQEEPANNPIERGMNGGEAAIGKTSPSKKCKAGTYQKIEDGVVGGYKKIENAFVGGYKRIEEGVVEGFEKLTDKFVEKLFAHEGETVEDARKRLNGEKQGEDR